MSFQDELRKSINEKRRVLYKLSTLPPIPFYTFTSGKRVIIHPTSVEELTRVRKFLRDGFGTWHDKLTQVWGCGQNVLISYGNKKLPWLEIWLSVDYRDVPAGVLEENCHVVIEQETHDEARVQCDL